MTFPDITEIEGQEEDPLFFKCNDCEDKEFDTQQGLSMHIARVHGSMKASPNADRKKCPVCRKYYHRTALTKHIKTHEREVDDNHPVVIPPFKPHGLVVKTGWQKLDNFVILEDNNGGIWLAEKIR